jgi:hybrid cluster-associated redox disulfide protein
MAEFYRDTMISEVLAEAPQSAPLFLSIGMHCLGCAMASAETIEEACEVHGVDADDFIERLNAYVSSKA